jgi:hypothetical protein
MTDPIAEPLTGTCLCGGVEITVNGALPQVDVCHCSMCRQWGGGPFGGIKGASFTVTGEDHITAYRSSEWAERAFCRVCGSNLWYHFIPADHFSFLAGLFDMPDGTQISEQIFVDEKPSWYDFAQKTPMKTGPEVIAEAKAAGFEFD